MFGSEVTKAFHLVSEVVVVLQQINGNLRRIAVALEQTETTKAPEPKWFMPGREPS